MGRLFGTPSVEVVATTKATAHTFLSYIKFDKLCRKFGHQFFPVRCTNVPTAGSKMRTTMWIRKPKFRKPRQSAPVDTEVDTDSVKGVIPQLINCARTASLTADSYGRLQKVKLVLTEKCTTQCTTTNDGKMRCVVLGAELTIPLTGFRFSPGTQVQLKRSTMHYIYAGLVTKPRPSALEMDQLLLYSQGDGQRRAIWVVPVGAVEQISLPSSDVPTSWGKTSEVVVDLEQKRIPFLKWSKHGTDVDHLLESPSSSGVPSPVPSSTPSTPESKFADVASSTTLRRSTRAHNLQTEKLKNSLQVTAEEMRTAQSLLENKRADLAELKKLSRNVAVQLRRASVKKKSSLVISESDMSDASKSSKQSKRSTRSVSVPLLRNEKQTMQENESRDEIQTLKMQKCVIEEKLIAS